MRLRWFKKLNLPLRFLVFSVLILLFFFIYTHVFRVVNSSLASFLLTPLKSCQDFSFNARELARFQDLSTENRILHSQLKQLNAENARMKDLELENQRLRAVLALPEKRGPRTVTAELIAEDSSNWRKTIVINKGRASGIAKGMPVISNQALAGRIIEAASNWSRAALITDATSKVPAKILRSRDQGLVYGAAGGRGDTCLMKYVLDAQPKDKVVSSGLGGIYPEGILIGEVLSVTEQKNRLYKIAQIKLAVDLFRLEEVLVIVE